MRVRRVDDNVLDTDLDEETVMMDIEQGRYYGLNEVGTRIWSDLAEPVIINDLVVRLSADFKVPTAQCQSEVIAFLESLASRGLLQVMSDESS
jgi:hypothetical protein